MILSLYTYKKAAPLMSAAHKPVKKIKLLHWYQEHLYAF